MHAHTHTHTDSLMSCLLMQPSGLGHRCPSQAMDDLSRDARLSPVLIFIQFFSSAEPHQYSEERWHDCVLVYSPL